MTIDPIDTIGANFIPAALPAIDPAQTATAAFSPGAFGATTTASAPADFGHWFARQLGEVNGQINQVDHEMQTLALGGTQSLHQFMIHMEESRLSFQLMAQVRNRLLEAYQEVMRMQV